VTTARPETADVSWVDALRLCGGGSPEAIVDCGRWWGYGPAASPAQCWVNIGFSTGQGRKPTNYVGVSIGSESRAKGNRAGMVRVRLPPPTRKRGYAQGGRRVCHTRLGGFDSHWPLHTCLGTSASSPTRTRRGRTTAPLTSPQ